MNKWNLITNYCIWKMKNIAAKQIPLASSGACYQIDGYSFIIDSKYELQFNKLISLYQNCTKHSLKIKLLTLLASLSIISLFTTTNENITFTNKLKEIVEDTIDSHTTTNSFANIDMQLTENIVKTADNLARTIETRNAEIKSNQRKYDSLIELNCYDLNIDIQTKNKIITLTNQIVEMDRDNFETFYQEKLLTKLDSAESLQTILDYLQSKIGTKGKKEIKELKDIVTKMANRKNRVYYDIPVYDLDFQDFIYETATFYDVPYRIPFVIAELESGGSWKSNGVLSNGNYGLTQINWYNLDYIEKNYGYKEIEVQNDPYINMECCIRLLHDKFLPASHYDSNNINYEEVFGIYNRWVLWQDYPEAIEYAENAINLLNTKYSGDFVVQDKEDTLTLELTQK